MVVNFDEARAADGLVGLVPTMGFFHEGHLSLMERAKQQSDTVLVSLYINPLQFGEEEDLDRYPRDLDRDAALAKDVGVDVLFVPPPEEMFMVPPATAVSVPELATRMEGRHRPGHFQGVATVVAKLLGGLQPDRLYLGRKDAQQLALIGRMANDLSFPVQVLAGPTIREHDGLALSSRNIHLGETWREASLTLSEGLMAAADAVEGGETKGAELEALAMERMAQHPDVSPDYSELASADDVSHVSRLDRPSFLAVAARVGPTRLIDNVHFDLVDNWIVPDRGIRLDQPSILYEEG